MNFSALRIVLLAYCAGFCGPFRVIVFAVSAVSLALISAGFLSTFGKEHEHAEVESASDGSDDQQPLLEKKVEQVPEETCQTSFDRSITSDTHLQVIGALCGLLFAAKHDWLVVLLLVFLLVAILKNGGEFNMPKLNSTLS